jgi:hypothetical protein
MLVATYFLHYGFYVIQEWPVYTVFFVHKRIFKQQLIFKILSATSPGEQGIPEWWCRPGRRCCPSGCTVWTSSSRGSPCTSLPRHSWKEKKTAWLRDPEMKFLNGIFSLEMVFLNINLKKRLKFFAPFYWQSFYWRIFKETQILLWF